MIKSLTAFFLLSLLSFGAKSQQTVELCPGSRTSFTYFSSSNTGGSWIWYLDGSIVSYTSSLTVDWRDTGYHTIRVFFASPCGRVIQTYLVHVIECRPAQIWWPNAFTPNGDGLNDTWGPIPINIRQVDYNVYNRWGERVFHSNSLAVRWNGMYKGMAADLANYVFYATWIDINGKPGKTKGNLILIR